MSGSTFHPWQMRILINGWYIRILLYIVSYENMSLVYVNSINCIMRVFVGFSDGVLYCGSHLLHSRSGLNLEL
jgi:hypothetical protein